MIKISKIFGDFVPRDLAFARAFSRRSAILKIVEEKALGTGLIVFLPHLEWKFISIEILVMFLSFGCLSLGILGF